MILSCINIRNVPREGCKPRASSSVFNTSLGTLRMLMNGTSCLIRLLPLYADVPVMQARYKKQFNLDILEVCFK